MEVRDLAVLGLQGALTTLRRGWVRGAAARGMDGTVYDISEGIPAGMQLEAHSAFYALELAFEGLDIGRLEQSEAFDLAVAAVGRFIGVDFTRDDPTDWGNLAGGELFNWEQEEGRTAGEVIAAFADAIAQLSRR